MIINKRILGNGLEGSSVGLGCMGFSHAYGAPTEHNEAIEDYLRRAHDVCPVTAVENRYSMMARENESLFPVMEELDVGLVAFSPMANGFCPENTARAHSLTRSLITAAICLSLPMKP